MNAVFVNARSGLRANVVDIAGSALNVANARARGATLARQAVDPNAVGPYQPNAAQRQSGPLIGVQVNLVTFDPASFQVYAPQDIRADADGFIASPNVDLPTEAVRQRTAARTYEANAAVIRVADDMVGALLDTVDGDRNR
jgi:flagellar basal-body rod protein FlgC